MLAWNPRPRTLFDVPIRAALGRKFRDLDVSYRVEGLRARIEDVKTRRDTRAWTSHVQPRNGDVMHADVDPRAALRGAIAHRRARRRGRGRDRARAAAEQITRIAEQHATAIEELQSTNEELETTNEELQSTNEELETTNEELQSTNEELETTIEELQAANTELAALNAELEARTADLNRIGAQHPASSTAWRRASPWAWTGTVS